MTDGLQRLVPLFEPVCDKLLEHNQKQKHKHASVDRYAAYKAMQQVKEGKSILAFCWAHVRRDFLEAARSWPTEEGGALGWVARIGPLDKDNAARREALDHEPAERAQKEGPLRQRIEEMAEQAKQELAGPKHHPARAGVLTSLQAHWGGRTVFVEHPEVALDNNTAERGERGPAVLRKNRKANGRCYFTCISAGLGLMVMSYLGTVSDRCRRAS